MGTIPLVSVVMNVHNGEKYLEEAIRSILVQSYRHFEFIIINDGSTDDTQSILDRLLVEDDRLQVFHQEQRGIYCSANRGCRVAKGKYIARFDADDISFSQRLELQVAFLEEHPHIAVLGTAVIRINGNGDPIETYSPPIEPSQVKATLPYWDAIVQPTAMMRKDNFLQLNGYREVYQLAGDYDLWMRMSEQFKLANLSEPLIYWRMHAGQVTNCNVRKHTIYTLVAQRAARMREKTGSDPLENVEAVTPEVLSELDISEGRIRKGFFEGCFERAITMLESGNKGIALQYLDQILTSSRSNPWRKRLAKKFAQSYVNAYKNRGQLVLNVLVFCWAGLTQFSNIGLLLRLKLRFFFHNRALLSHGQKLSRKTAKRSTLGTRI